MVGFAWLINATGTRRSLKAKRFMLNAMLAIPIFAVARAIPMV